MQVREEGMNLLSEFDVSGNIRWREGWGLRIDMVGSLQKVSSRIGGHC